MQKKNIIRSLGSFMLFPAMTLSMPVGPLPSQQLDIAPHQIILAQFNTESPAEKAIKEAEAKKAQILEAKADAIDAYLAKRGAPMAGYGKKFVEAAEENGLHPFLLPSIATAETGAGKELCKRLPKHNNKNPFGYGSCTIGYPSFDVAIEKVAWNLGGNNPNTDQYYAGKTTEEIISKYNPEVFAPGYKKKVLKIMEAIGQEEIIPEVNT